MKIETTMTRRITYIWKSKRVRAPVASFCCASRTFHLASAKDHIAALENICGPGIIISSEDDIAKYSHDWTQRYHGGLVVALPRTTAQVSSLLNYCNSNRIGVVPQGQYYSRINIEIGKLETN